MNLHRRFLAVSLICLALPTCAAADPRIAFDTHGGDAWTFELRVSGQASREDCDSIAVQSPLGTVTALRIDRGFVAEVPLQPGTNRLEAICRHAGREVARSEPQLWRVPLADIPKAWTRVRVDGQTVHLDAGRTQPAAGRPAPLVRYEWAARAGNPAELRLSNGQPLEISTRVSGEHLQLTAPARDGEYYVLLAATDALGRIDHSAAVFRVSEGRPQVVDLQSEHPAWVDPAVLYGAAPYNFDPQSFAGVRERLDEIAALGATAVWLSPVNQAASDDFGYSVVNHFALREQFGTERELRALVNEAHRLGLRVLVDFVPNHLSDQSTYYLDAARHGARSPYHDWFERAPDGEITHYFDWTHLQNLDFDNPQVRNYITAAFARFVREYDVDGFRVDASWAVAQRAPEFWPELREELKRIDPDIFLLAEASAREPYHVANGFDAAYDWTWNLGEWAWRDAFGDGDVDVERLRAALTNRGEGFPADSLILRFLNNNDTGERFVSRHGRPLARLAATMLLTLPGLPLIYNGDEVGAAFEPYDEGPPIEWEDADPLTAHYRQLTTLRREHASLWTREMKLLKTTHADAVLSYLRPGRIDNEDILVVLNFSDRELEVSASGRESASVLQRFAHSKDLLSGETHHLDEQQPMLRVPPMSALMLGASE